MEYIVAYSGSEANIRRKKKDEDFCHNTMNDLYICALSRYPDKTYGDIVAYNNQLWGVVDAENAANALTVFLKKDMQEQLKK